MHSQTRNISISLAIFAISMLSAISASAGLLESLAPATDPGVSDTLRLESGISAQGKQLVLPIHFFCDEDLGGIQVLIGFDQNELVCDSVSFVGSTVTLGGELVTIDSLNGKVNAGVIYVSEDVIPPQTGVLGSIYFSQLGAPHGALYSFDSTSIQVDSITVVKTVFSTTNPATSIFPKFVGATISLPEFLPGDANNDHKISIGDVTFLIALIFAGGEPPVNPAAADANASCTINIGDVTHLIAHIFTSGPEPQLGCAQ